MVAPPQHLTLETFIKEYNNRVDILSFHPDTLSLTATPSFPSTTPKLKESMCKLSKAKAMAKGGP